VGGKFHRGINHGRLKYRGRGGRSNVKQVCRIIKIKEGKREMSKLWEGKRRRERHKDLIPRDEHQEKTRGRPAKTSRLNRKCSRRRKKKEGKDTSWQLDDRKKKFNKKKKRKKGSKLLTGQTAQAGQKEKLHPKEKKMDQCVKRPVTVGEKEGSGGVKRREKGDLQMRGREGNKWSKPQMSTTNGQSGGKKEKTTISID